MNNSNLALLPSPKHVLEMGAKINLSPTQFEEAKNIYDRMYLEATRIGKLIIEKEKELEILFAIDDPSFLALQLVTREIARLQGELRIVHLEAHLEIKKLLSPEQILNYKEVREKSNGTKGLNNF